jgi:hypothetical protein
MVSSITLAGIDLTKTGSTPLYSLGLSVPTEDGTYQYVKHALAAAVAGDAFKIQEDYTTVALTTTESGDEPTNVGVFQVGIDAGTVTAQYGWLFTGFGNFQAKIANGVTAGAALTTTANAGILGTGGDVVAAACVTANTSGSAAVRACYAPGKLRTNG